MSEAEWALSEIRNDVETIFFRKNLEPHKSGDVSGYSNIIYFTCGCNNEPTGGELVSKVDGDAFEVLESKLLAVAADTASVLVCVVSAFRMKDFILYSANPEGFLETINPLLAEYPQFQIGCQYSEDSDWSQYKDLPGKSDVR